MALNPMIPMGVRQFSPEPRENALARVLAERNALQQAQMRAMQMQQIQAAMQEQARARQAAEQQAQARAQAMAQIPSPQMLAGQRALAGGGGPTAANAEAVRPVDPRAMALWQAMQAGLIPMEKGMEALDPNFGREEVKQFVETQGGRLPVNRFGDPAGKPVPFAPEVQMLQLGDKYQAVDKRTVAPGASFAVGMSPGERATQARAAESNNIARQRLALDRDAAVAAAGGPSQAALTREFGKAPKDRRWLPNGKLEVIPGSEADTAKTQSTTQAADKAKAAYTTLDQMLSHPGLDTAVGMSGQLDPRNYVWGTEAQGAKALIEQAQGQAFLQAFESLKGGGQITQVEGEKATQAIARLQRAQSESDFKAAAEDLKKIANDAHKRLTGKSLEVVTKPVNTRLGVPAATLDALVDKYRSK